MTEALLMHGADDARDALARGLTHGRVLLSTHPSADMVLADGGLACCCLSAYLTEEELTANRDVSAATVDAVVGALDAAYAGVLAGSAGLPEMRVFRPLYDYVGRYHASAYHAFGIGLREAATAEGFDTVLAYDRALDVLLHPATNFRALCDALAQGVKVALVDGAPAAASMPAVRLAGLPERARRLVSRLPGEMRARRRWAKPRPGLPTLVLAEPLHDLSFLSQHLDAYDVVYLPRNADLPLGAPVAPEPMLPALPAVTADVPEAEDPLAALIVADFLADFRQNGAAHLQAAATLHEVCRARRPVAAIWGNPPNIGGKALAFELMLATGVPVIGTQHGAVYVDSVEPWHFPSDFDRCDHFLSYGFTAQDLSRTYPDVDARCDIHPCGSVLAHDIPRAARRVDVLFPLTNSLSVLTEGMARTAPDVLHTRQVRILERLEALAEAGLSVTVKPFPNATEAYCSVMPLLGRLRAARVAWHVTLRDFLAQRQPRLVVIEYPSQPLFDVLPLDCDVVVIADRVLPLEPQARAMLERRVHLCDTLDEALEAVDAFEQGRLERRRDDAFLTHYVTKPDVRERILAAVDDVASGRHRTASTHG